MLLGHSELRVDGGSLRPPQKQTAAKAARRHGRGLEPLGCQLGCQTAVRRDAPRTKPRNFLRILEPAVGLEPTTC